MSILGAFEHVNCPICGSNNVMVYSLLNEDESIYMKIKLSSCINNKIGFYTKFEKYGNKIEKKIQLSKNINTKNQKDLWAVDQMFNHIVGIIKTQGDFLYSSSISGNTEIMAFGNIENYGVETQVNKFISIGILKNELYKCLYVIGRKLELDFINNGIFTYINKKNFQNGNEFESVKFKGALMNEFFTYEADEELKEFVKYKNNMCCKLGTKIIAFGIPDSVDPNNYYHYKKEKEFIIPPNITPIIINHHFVYFAVEINEDDLPF